MERLENITKVPSSAVHGEKHMEDASLVSVECAFVCVGRARIDPRSPQGHQHAFLVNPCLNK